MSCLLLFLSEFQVFSSPCICKIEEGIGCHCDISGEEQSQKCLDFIFLSSSSLILYLQIYFPNLQIIFACNRYGSLSKCQDKWDRGQVVGSLGGFAAWRLMMEVLENQGGRREFIDLLKHLKRSYYFISSIFVPHFPPLGKFLKGQVF